MEASLGLLIKFQAAWGYNDPLSQKKKKKKSEVKWRNVSVGESAYCFAEDPGSGARTHMMVAHNNLQGI